MYIIIIINIIIIIISSANSLPCVLIQQQQRFHLVTKDVAPVMNDAQNIRVGVAEMPGQGGEAARTVGHHT